MTLREQTLFDYEDKVDKAIKRLKEFEPEEGYYLAFSGGKDSVVIKALADMAKVKYDAHYSVVGIDPPELVKFIKRYHKDVIFDRPDRSFWKSLVKKGYPTRQMRWCCELLKEKHGLGRTIITGIRWEESVNRKSRELFEEDFDRDKKYLNVIIEWDSEEVWEFIRQNNIPYCELYDQGWYRIGCLFCPNNRERINHVEMYPGYVQTFKRFFKKRYEYCKEKGLTSATRFESGDDMFNFWIYSKKSQGEKSRMFD